MTSSQINKIYKQACKREATVLTKKLDSLTVTLFSRLDYYQQKKPFRVRMLDQFQHPVKIVGWGKGIVFTDEGDIKHADLVKGVQSNLDDLLTLNTKLTQARGRHNLLHFNNQYPGANRPLAEVLQWVKEHRKDFDNDEVFVFVEDQDTGEILTVVELDEDGVIYRAPNEDKIESPWASVPAHVIVELYNQLHVTTGET